MKNKILTILMIITSLCFFTSCGKIVNKEAKSKVADALNSINLPKETSQNITLAKNINGFDVIWSSSNPEVLSADGKVTLGIEDVEVVLTAKIFHSGDYTSRDFEIKVCKDSNLISVNETLNSISLPNEVSVDKIELPSTVNGFEVVWSSSNTKVIKNDGKVVLGKEDVEVELVASIVYNGVKSEKSFKVLVKVNPGYALIENAIESVVIPSETYENLTLPTEINGVAISWSTNRSTIITKTGEITRSIEDSTGILTAVYTSNGVKESKVYYVTVKGYTDKEKLEYVIDKIEFEEELYKNITLSDKFDYGITATWESDNQEVLSNAGEYNYNENVSSVTLKLTLVLGSEEMTKEFIFKLKEKVVLEKDHLIIERANELNESNLVDLKFENGRIVLIDGAVEGTYTSDVIETKDFESLVASWAATSSSNATVEVLVRARVNGAWSEYISYRKWGLGLKNALDDQSNSLIQLSDDEVLVKNSKTANAIQYKFILRRDAVTIDSPKLSLVAFAIEIPGYSHPVDLTKYPSSIVYSVPKLYQQIVPTIGNSICSPTSSTMLLKYKGEDFSAFDQYEHRYIANLFKDYGNDIFGNWVYCAVGMGAYGYDAYVARYYSVEELVEHLAVIGPCAISVKGQMTSDKKNYYTGGHLLVAIGYEFDANGNLTIVCNDPNVSEVECRYTKAVIESTWRGVIYSIE